LSETSDNDSLPLYTNNTVIDILTLLLRVINLDVFGF
jgi:hypothetical protein